MPGKKVMAIFAVMAVLALSACVEQGTENHTGAPPAEPTGVPPAGSEIPIGTPPAGTVQQPRRQDTNATPVEEPGAQPTGTEEVPGFEAYLALGAIGLAGAAVALTHRKKKE